MEAWTPAATGAAFEYTRILKPLEAFRDRTLVLSGLAHKNAYALGDGPGDHARAAACYLTGVHPKKTAGADIKNSVSVDQIAAQHIGTATRFPSLELGCDDSRTVGNCDSGYSCAYTNSLSWRSETAPNPPETNPRLVFERLFGSFDAGLDPETRARRQDSRRSVLDLVTGRTAELVKTLGTADRRKVDEYLSSIREVERRIQMAEQDLTGLPEGLEKPTGIPVTYDEYAALMFDLQVLALQADLTRVVTMMMGREGSMRTYPEIGVPDPHHPLTHHRNTPEWIEKVRDGVGAGMDRCAVRGEAAVDRARRACCRRPERRVARASWPATRPSPRRPSASGRTRGRARVGEPDHLVGCASRVGVSIRGRAANDWRALCMSSSSSR